jgi:SAM-dependent methyltransferase
LQKNANYEPPGSPITAVALATYMTSNHARWWIWIVRFPFFTCQSYALFVLFLFLSLIEGFYHYIEAVDQFHNNHYHFSTLIILAMASYTLPQSAYIPQSLPQDRRYLRNTFIEEEPQETQRYIQEQQQQMLRHYSTLSTIIDASPVSEKEVSFETRLQHARRMTQGHASQYNDLYDLTDDEADEIPIRISASISSTPQATPMSKRFPSLVIPSPSAWPSIHNYHKKGVDAPLLSPSMLSPAIVSPTPRALSQMVARHTDTASSRAPSLDGSMTSEELSNLSCPSTPDIERMGDNGGWSSPIQLHPQALRTLDCLTGTGSEVDEPIMFVPQMREVDEQRPQLEVDVGVMSEEQLDRSELSALSVPSPGGFFSTLEPTTRNAWLPTSETPSTSIAERFYNVPWASRAEDTLEQVVEMDYEDNVTEGPPTARRIPLASPQFIPEHQNDNTQTTEIFMDPTEYKETYQEEIRAVSTANFDRTTMWLQSQDDFDGDDLASGPMSAPLPSKRESMASIESVLPPTPSKSVRFAIESPTEESPVESEEVVEKEPIFVQSFEHLSLKSNPKDAFVHRKTRTEKLRLDRECLFASHVNNLDGKFELEQEARVASNRPTSDFFTGEVQEEDLSISHALRERRALEQVKPVSWNLEATKMLNGGTLLTSPTGKLMPNIHDGRVLDLGGQASCDWAWQVAVEHPSSTVHTVYTADQGVDPSIQTPMNHKQTKVPNLWTLPFPNDHFHVISARNLMSLLKTNKPSGKARDEYDLCLKECMRVLKPGGYLEFALLDADIVGGGRQASALSVEFVFNLKSRGYDSCPTKAWLPRLRRAGFAQVRRAWLTLPVARPSEEEGTTADASHISGLVGSWAWERWMLKLHREMGRDADRLLEGVPSALEEGSQTGASWRYLSGWARKPM